MMLWNSRMTRNPIFPPLFVAPLLVPSASVCQPLTAAQEQAWRAQIRSNFFIPDPLPALAAQTHRRFRPAPGVSAEAVTYATQFGTRVPAILYLPDPLPKTVSGKIPGFIVVNGHGGDKYCWYSFYTGVLYARGGVAVLTYDQIGEGERNVAHKSGSRAHDYIKGGEELARHLAGAMMTDEMQAVSYLASRPEVDPARIGAAGYSLGSFVVGLTGAIESRLRACVMVGGGNWDGPGGYWDTTNKPMCQRLPYLSLNFLGDRPAALYALRATYGPTLAWNGLHDTVVGMDKHGEALFKDLRERVIKMRGTEQGIFEAGFHPTGSHRPYCLTRPVAQWLKRQIDFPNWTDAAIAAMPETRIGDWAERHGILMDKLYATEERESGTRALGDDIPGYSRDDLNVFTPQEWEARKKEFILETWLQAAQEAIGRKPSQP